MFKNSTIKTLTAAFVALFCSTAIAGGGILYERQKLLPADNQAGDYFGISVSIDNTNAVVGAYSDDDAGFNFGSAYVYKKDTAGSHDMTLVDKLLPDSNTKYFGTSVSISGNKLVSGTIYDGSAFFFENIGSGWIQDQRLVGSGSDHFGEYVSISGDTAVVGAFFADDNGADSGAAYVYQDTASGWTQVAKLLPSDGAAGDRFGWSVKIDGNTVIVGARHNDDNGEDSGAAYVFEKPTAGWSDMTQIAKLLPDDGAAGDWFGYAVSFDGDAVIVGAPKHDDNGGDSGAAYVFEKPTAGWSDMTQTAKLLPDDGAAGDQYGFSVDINGGNALVGSWYDDDNGAESGSAYFFQEPSGGWSTMTQTAKLLVSDGLSDDRAGCSVAISGDTAIIGAYGCHDNGTWSGSAYVFVVPEPSTLAMLSIGVFMFGVGRFRHKRANRSSCN